MTNLYAQYHALRLERLNLQTKVNLLEQKEKDLMYEITKTMVADNETDAVKDGYRARLVVKDTALVTDWPNLIAYIRETGALDLFQKRVTESAVKARWASGVEIPGVKQDQKYVLTITEESV